MLDPHQICTANASIEFLNSISTLSIRLRFEEVSRILYDRIVMCLIGQWYIEMMKEIATKIGSIQGSSYEDKYRYGNKIYRHKV